MKIVSVISSKGGVGKTTTALSLCQSTSATGLRTLLIDFDNQANATASLVPVDDSLKHHNAYDLVEGNESVEPMVVSAALSLIPAANQLTQLDREDFDVFFRLRERVRGLFEGRYDVVVIDTPGNLGTRVISAMVAADALYVPVELTHYSMQALGPLLDLMKRTTYRFNNSLEFLGFLPNRVTEIRNGKPALIAEREVYDKLLEKFGTDKVLGLIAQRRSIKDTMSTGGSVDDIQNDPSGRRAQDELTQFANTVIRKLGLVPPALAVNA